MGALKLALLSQKLYKFSGGGGAQILKNVNRIIYACDISYEAKIHPSCWLAHQGLGVVIGAGSEIGKNTIIRQNVTIGGKNVNGQFVCPIVGDNVMIGAGAVLLGKIRIGNNVQIGANSVVLDDVPDNVTVVGAPARIVNK